MKGAIAVIIPAHNEADTLAAVLRLAQKSALPIVVVDDGSTDRTNQIACQAGVHLLRHRLNLGKGAAMTTGAAYAFGQLQAGAIIFLDADGQHDPQELPRFAQLLRDGAKVVLGVRQLGGEMPADRVMGNKLTSWANQFLFGAYIPDILSGYKAFSRTAYEQLRWEAVGYEVEMEIAAKLAATRLPFYTVPIQTFYFDLRRGMNLLDSGRAVFHLLALCWRGRILKR